MDDRFARVAAIAGRQHGVVHGTQLRLAGCSSSTVSRWAKRGLIHRVAPSVYAVGHVALGDRARWHVALLGGGPDAMLTASTAARAWQIWCRPAPVRLHVATTSRPRSRSDVTYHRSGSLPMDHVIIDGLRTATVARTIADLAHETTAAGIARIMHEAAFRGVLDVAAVEALVPRVSSRVSTRLRSAVTLHRGGSAGTRSVSEDRVLGLVSSMPITQPHVCVPVECGGHVFELDLWWPSERVCVEVDGPHHARPRTAAQDDRRGIELARAGIDVVRVSTDDVWSRPRSVTRRIARALARAGAGGLVLEPPDRALLHTSSRC